MGFHSLKLSFEVLSATQWFLCKNLKISTLLRPNLKFLDSFTSDFFNFLLEYDLNYKFSQKVENFES